MTSLYGTLKRYLWVDRQGRCDVERLVVSPRGIDVTGETDIVGETMINMVGSAATYIGNLVISGITDMIGDPVNINNTSSGGATNIGYDVSGTHVVTIKGTTIDMQSQFPGTGINIGGVSGSSAVTTAIDIEAGLIDIGTATNVAFIDIGSATSQTRMFGDTTLSATSGDTTTIGNTSASNVSIIRPAISGTKTITDTTTFTGTTNINTTGSSSSSMGNATGDVTLVGAQIILNGSGAGSVFVGSDGTSTVIEGQTIGIGNLSTGHVISIGNDSGSTQVNGPVTINTASTSTTSIGNTNAATNISTPTITGVTNLNSTGTATTNIGNSGATTNITKPTITTPTITGVTNINSTGTDSTSIGNTGATTTITNASMTFPTSGGTATTLNYHEEASESLTASGCFNANQAVTVNYVRIGKQIMVQIPAINAAAAAGAALMTFTAITSRFRPAVAQRGTIPVKNGTASGTNTSTGGSWNVTTGGVLTIAVGDDSNPSGAGFFSTSNNNGIFGVTLCWKAV